MNIKNPQYRLGEKVAVIRMLEIEDKLRTVETIRLEVGEKSQKIWYLLKGGGIYEGKDLLSAKRLVYVAEQCRLTLQGCGFSDFPEIESRMTRLMGTAKKLLAEISRETKEAEEDAV